MTLTLEDLHTLFCPAESWYEARLNCVTDDEKVNWHLCLLEYCKAVKRAVNKELKESALKIEAEIRDQKVLEEKMRRKK
jgi:hypothetical protein